MNLFDEPVLFEWDEGNQDKNWKKHRVAFSETEEVFFDPHKRLIKEAWHVGDASREVRYILLGKTSSGRALFIVFTIRRGKVRVISARDLSRRERKLLA